MVDPPDGREVRSRLRSLESGALPLPGATHAAPFVGRALAGATSAPLRFIGVVPVTVAGDEVEGSPAVLSDPEDTDDPRVVVWLGGSLVAGQHVICRYVDYRWVAGHNITPPPHFGVLVLVRCIPPCPIGSFHSPDGTPYTFTAYRDGVLVVTGTGFYSRGWTVDISMGGTFTFTVTYAGGTLTETIAVPGTFANPVIIHLDYSTFPGCCCWSDMPHAWTLTSTNQTCNCSLYQDASLNWGPCPIPGGPDGWYSGPIVGDCGDDPYNPFDWSAFEGTFYYHLVCFGGMMELRVMATDPFTGGFSEGSVARIGNDSALHGPGTMFVIVIESPPGNFPPPWGWCADYWDRGVFYHNQTILTIAPA